jgi:TrmH family RNA methyltransferase
LARFKVVASRENPQFKRLRALAASSQARKKEGLSLLAGAHLVGAYLARGGVPALVAAGEAALARDETTHLLAGYAGAALRLSDAMLDAISGVEHGAGIVAAVPTPRARLPADIDEDCVLLEGLQDPGNLGSVLRSAAAAGVRRVVCSAQTVYAWSPKVLRAGQGAHFGLDIVEGCAMEEVLARLRVPLIATSSHARATLFAADLTRPLAWVFGNEGAGVSPEVLARADQTVAIPLAAGSESLNVAAAAAVCLFEAARQRQAAGAVR